MTYIEEILSCQNRHPPAMNCHGDGRADYRLTVRHIEENPDKHDEMMESIQGIGEMPRYRSEELIERPLCNECIKAMMPDLLKMGWGFRFESVDQSIPDDLPETEATDLN